MKQLTAIVAAVLLLAAPALAATHAVSYADTTGLTLYAYPASQSLASWATYRVALAEGSSPNTGRYAGTLDDAQGAQWFLFEGANQPSSWDAAIGQTALPVAATTIRAEIDANSTFLAAISSAISALNDVSAADLLSAASAALVAYDPPTKAEVDAAVAAAGGGVSADIVSDKLTWFCVGSKAQNIVEVEGGSGDGTDFAGTLALAPDLNPGATILSVDAVSITGAATVTATGLAPDRSKKKAHFTVPALTTAGTYTVRVTVTTVDDATITSTATLKVN